MHSFQPFLNSTSEIQYSSQSQLYHVQFMKNYETTSVTINSQMFIILQENSILTSYQLSPLLTIIPHFNAEMVHQITVHKDHYSFSIRGENKTVNDLYKIMSRKYNHKGFSEFYKPLRRLGRGTFATVYLVEHKYTGKRKAAKVFSREGQKIELKGKQALDNEIKTLRQLSHPNVIQFDGVYETDNLIYLITQYLSGGTLQETLKSKCIHSGELIQRIMTNLLSALSYLNQKNIMHRDIKPQNIILRSQDNNWVLGDFGLVGKSNQEYLYDKCGTMGYIAPQIMHISQKQKYTQACDIYSLGVIAYQLIVGQLPFKVESQNFFDKKIVWVLFERQQCQKVHPNVINFLMKLLEKDPKKRIKPKQALKHEFFTDKNVVEALIAFHEEKRRKRYERILQIANH